MPTVEGLAPPDPGSAWSLPPRYSAVAPEPEHWYAGPAVWGARPLQPRRIDGLALLTLAALSASAPAVIAGAMLGHRAAAILGFLITFVIAGALACWLELRTSKTKPLNLERGVLARDVSGLKARFVGGTSVDGLTVGTRVAIGQSRSGEVCMYAHGREYPLTRSDLDRVRSAMAHSLGVLDDAPASRRGDDADQLER